ncbi:MAG: hypothetical protein AUK63_950 [bacterium P3]|nr:MAG: hypothetical protein AUK64_1107 [bacterium P201]KWW30504.1 MAG: hypothetical protein AUK63_950 [bacterium P3]KWW41391.1 MAG: hypothetical protein F083_1138 [bacterium F083]
MKKINRVLPIKKNGYDWKYCSIGGVTRVSVETGDDIAHLGELDEKMWTVLSCPVKGLEFDERTLTLMDNDGDGRIRVHEVVNAAQWLCRVLVDANLLRQGSAELSLADINIEDSDGRALRDMAQHVLDKLQKTGRTIAIADLDAYRTLVDEQIRAEHEARPSIVVDQPFGEKSDALLAAVEAVRDKVDDYFLRCRLVSYDENSAAVLDMSVERLGSISQHNLAACVDELATYPLASAGKDALLHLDSGVNPVWQSAVDALRQVLSDIGFETPDTLSESQWAGLRDKALAYGAAKSEALQQRQKELDDILAAELAVSRPLEKLLFLYRDFYRLLHNFVLMSDFYAADRKAIFQAGRLYIDQRCCELCLRVADMSKHADTMAGLSGMYLIYCSCTSKVKNATIDIVAVLTNGDVDDLRVGKNALFYDRDGLDWDATITKIVDNPISIRQAFWSPYKKFWNWCTEKLNKSAAEKEAKNLESMTSGAEKLTEETKLNAAAPDANKQDNKKQPFDIAKFAGIFAAIGMAVGYIVGAISGLASSFTAKPLNALIFILCIMAVISGPSVFLAWLKLRKRNLGPVLNANGWAVNAKILVNVRFGATLTGLAQYPKLVLDDPFADKKTPAWRKWLYAVLVVALIVFAILFFTKSLPWQKDKVAQPAELVEEAPAALDTTDLPAAAADTMAAHE